MKRPLEKKTVADLTEPLMTIAEVAALTRIPVNTLYHYRATGQGGPPSAKIGRRVMYRRADVLDYIESAFAVSA
jgi:excisionase family DNA binding protein